MRIWLVLGFVVAGALGASAFACGSDNASSSSSSASSGGSSSGSSTSGGSSGASSGAASSSGASSCDVPAVDDAGGACTADDDCVIRMVGNRCCPQIAQAITKEAAAANPPPTGPCDCPPTPCAPPPTSTAKCDDAGLCIAVTN